MDQDIRKIYATENDVKAVPMQLRSYIEDYIKNRKRNRKQINIGACQKC